MEQWSETLQQLLHQKSRMLELLQLEAKVMEALLAKAQLPEQSTLELEPLLKQHASEVQTRLPGASSSEPIATPLVSPDVGLLYSSRKGHQREQLLQCLYDREWKDVRPTFLLFSMEDLDMERSVIHGELYSEQHLQAVAASFPPFIYNLGSFSKPDSLSKMRHLRTRSDVTVVNPVNRYPQDILMEILSSNPSSASNSMLLPFQALHPPALDSFLSTYDEVLLVPQKEAGHPTGIRISRKQGSNEVTLHTGPHERSIPIRLAYDTVKKMVRSKGYMIMKGIEPLKWNGLPLECRIYVQRGRSGEWEETCQIAKLEVFAGGSIHQHDSASLADILKQAAPSMGGEISAALTWASLSMASFLSYYVTDLGSCYFDFLLDSKGNPYLFYTGGVEQYDYAAKAQPEEGAKLYWSRILDYLEYKHGTASRRKDQGGMDDVD